MGTFTSHVPTKSQALWLSLLVLFMEMEMEQAVTLDNRTVGIDPSILGLGDFLVFCLIHEETTLAQELSQH